LLSELNAKIAFNTIGKKQTKTTIITLGINPKPNQDINSGAKAILGVISILTKKGYKVLLNIDEKEIAIPKPKPKIKAIMYPSTVSSAVTPV
jgi:hypothetical protein